MIHVPPRRVRSLSIVVPLFAISACAHSDVFGPRGNDTSDPLVPAVPTVLTYNPADDQTPAWLPDGTGFIYAFDSPTVESDECLGIMPSTGGRRLGDLCNGSTFSHDSTDTFIWPSVSSDGQLAYVRNSRPVSAPGRGEFTSYLATSPLSRPDDFVRLRSFPFQSGDAFIVAPASVTWVSPSRIAFVGLVDTSVPIPCTPGGTDVCGFLLVRSGHHILIADVTGGAALVTPVSGTEWATSVAATGDPDRIYFTVAASSKIMQVQLSTGAITTVHDFGAGGIARDVQVNGGLVAAVVGGWVKLRPDGSTTAPIQDDFAGRLFVFDPAAGTERELAAPSTLFRHPALSPDGSSVVAEAYHIDIVGSDTLRVQGSDLWGFPTR